MVLRDALALLDPHAALGAEPRAVRLPDIKLGVKLSTGFKYMGVGLLQGCG